MNTTATHAVTRALAAVVQGDSDAANELLSLVYEELRRMAYGQMAREPAGHTLQPTALVHEAYLRLFAGGEGAFENRRHFFAAAARAMQQIRVDDARRRGRLKRGGAHRLETDAAKRDGASESPRIGIRGLERSERDVAELAIFDDEPAEVLDLDEALGRLDQQHPDLAEVVRLRYFVGLTVDEVADLLGVAPRTIGNRWQLARAWLHNALREE